MASTKLAAEVQGAEGNWKEQSAKATESSVAEMKAQFKGPMAHGKKALMASWPCGQRGIYREETDPVRNRRSRRSPMRLLACAYAL